MWEKVTDLQKKEVINISDGRRLGFLYDVEIDLENGTVGSLVVPGRARFFGLFRAREAYVIGFSQIKKVGDDIILVEFTE